MKIVFLGTGHGVPSATRACSCAMIEVGGALYYVDGGAPIVDRTLLSGRDISAVRAMFITHVHGDHIGGVFQFADLIQWYYKTQSCSFFFPEMRAADALRGLIEAAEDKPLDEERIHLLPAKEGLVYEDENVRVSYYKTLHLTAEGRHSYGILIEAEGKRVYFSGDLSYKLGAEDFPAIAYEDIDLFVCEMAHFGRENLEPYLPRIRAKVVAFNHVYPLVKYEDIENIGKEFGYKVIAPSDMDEIEI